MIGHQSRQARRKEARQRMNGIADVARPAGLSKPTASLALTGSGYVSAETRSRVI